MTHILGGVALLRAAAKNHERVTVLCDPSDYDKVIDEMSSTTDRDTTAKTRQALAVKVRKVKCFGVLLV